MIVGKNKNTKNKKNNNKNSNTIITGNSKDRKENLLAIDFKNFGDDERFEALKNPMIASFFLLKFEARSKKLSRQHGSRFIFQI